MATATASKAPRAVKPPQAKDQPLLIGGKWLDSVSGKTFATVNPATGGGVCPGAEGENAGILRAVKAARKAVHEGPGLQSKGSRRGHLVSRVARLLQESQSGVDLT